MKIIKNILKFTIVLVKNIYALFQVVVKNSLLLTIKKFIIEYIQEKNHINVKNVEMNIMIEQIINIILELLI